MAKKTLYYVQTVTDITTVEQYIKERRIGTVPVKAENLFDFLNKTSDEDVTEIIFDYDCVNQIYGKGESLASLQKANLRKASIIVTPPVATQKEMQKAYCVKLKKLIPEIKEKLF